MGGTQDDAQDLREMAERLRREAQATAAELRAEAEAAAFEVHAELRQAGREATDALRQAMEETRRALREAQRAVREEVPPPAGAAERPTRAQRKELTRELLLDAAAEVFASKGFHGASLDDVADAAGFTKGAVYSNFATKSELVMALLERHGRQRGDALARAIAWVPLEALPDLAQGWLQEQAPEERAWAILAVEFWLAAMRDQQIRERLVAHQRDSVGRLGAIVQAKIDASGRPHDLSGEEVVRLIDALGTGLLWSGYLEPDAAPASADLFARALRKLLAEEPATG